MSDIHTPGTHPFAWPWQMGQTTRRSFGAANVDDRAAVKTWYPAAVPGNVRADLLALGLIPDPYQGDNVRHSAWVDQADWWYRSHIDTRLQPGERAFVRFGGLDYRSAVFVNGREILRHEGMFAPVRVELTEALQNGPCELAVRIWGSGALPRRQLSWPQRLWQPLAGLIQGNWLGAYPDRTATLKMQMGFGWDFAPPLRTCGLWDEVHFIRTGPAFICHTAISTRPDGRGQIRLQFDGPAPVRAQLSLSPLNFTGEALHTHVALQSDSGHHCLSFQIPNPQLWQPWERGFPHRYRARLQMDGAAPIALDFGLRTVALKQHQFWLNGERLFVRGVNWVPADILPGRVSATDYADLLSEARAAGVNLLRVWGGGLREKRAFYEQCDELGLLVWQEFPLACMFLGTYPREAAFLRLVQQEVGSIVRQLDPHPSVILWSGGNEFSPRRNRPLVQTIRHTVQENERNPRPFLPASPGPNDAHNWHVWHGGQSFRAYRREKAALLSEFGLQALPQRQTLAAVLPNPARDWTSRHGEAAKLHRYAQLAPPSLTEQQPPEADPFDVLIAASQWAQATGLQIAIEHMRRRQQRAGGVIIWQFNEPWPAVSWALLDYNRRPKLAWQRLPQWYNPILLCLDFEPGEMHRAGQTFQAHIWGINDSLTPAQGLATIWLDGRLIWRQQVTLPPNKAQRLGRLRHPLQAAPQQLRLNLQHENHCLSRNSYDLNWVDPVPPNYWQRLRRIGADLALR